MKGILRYTYLLIAIVALAACKKDFDGTAKENTPPETYVVTDTIVRQGDERFTSQVKIQWWGSDADGYITAYEYRINDSAWVQTQKQDSVFTLIIPSNSDTFDFKFEIRSIDNKGATDPTPAVLFYPVKNSNPTVSFYVSTAITSRNPVRSFPALRFTWIADDLDGIASLDSFEICWNDTTGVRTKIAPGIRDVLLVGKNLTAASTPCDIYLGSNQTPWNKTIDGLKLNDSNILYIRAIDKTGAASKFVASNQIFVRKPQGDILVINAVESQFTRAPIQNFYLTSLGTATAKPYDVLLATDRNGNNYTELSPDPFTQAQIFGFFKRIFWFSDNTESSLGLLQKSSSVFFGKGGRMMVVVAANDNIPTDPTYVDFTPIKSYLPVSNKDAFLMQQQDSLVPVNAAWPILRTPNFLTGIRPFELQINNTDFAYETLYNGLITNEKNSKISRWTGTSTLISKRVRKSDNKTDFIISVVPLHLFNDLGNFDAFMNRAINTELEF
jgi:hypothetical protein